MTLSKSDLPQTSHGSLDSLDVDLPELPGDWSWRTFNHLSNGKVNVFFSVDVNEPGGWYGEIDNYTTERGEMWTLHVHEIVDDETPSGMVAEEAETSVEFESLSEAVKAVPDHVATHYGGGE